MKRRAEFSIPLVDAWFDASMPLAAHVIRQCACAGRAGELWTADGAYAYVPGRRPSLFLRGLARWRLEDGRRLGEILLAPFDVNAEQPSLPVFVSASGRHLVARASASRVAVILARPWQEVSSWHIDAGAGLHVTRDGTVAVAFSDGGAHAWHTEGGHTLWRADDTWLGADARGDLGVFTDGSTLRVRALATGAVLRAQPAPASALVAASCDADGGSITALTASGELVRADAAPLRAGDLVAPSAVVVSPTGALTAVQERTHPGVESAWRTVLLRGDRVVAARDDVTSNVTFTADERGALLAVGQRLARVDTRTGAWRDLHAHHLGPVRHVAFTPRGEVLSGSDDGSLRVWAPGAPVAACVLEGHGAPVRALAVSPDGRAAASSAEGSTIVWQLAEGVERARLADPVPAMWPEQDFPRHTWQASALAWSRDGERLAGVVVATGDTGDRDANRLALALWEPSRDGVSARPLSSWDATRLLGVTDDAVVLASPGGDLCLRDLRTGDVLRATSRAPAENALVRLLDGAHLLVLGDREGFVRALDTGALSPRLARPPASREGDAVVSADGEVLAAVSRDGRHVRVWQVGAMRPLGVASLPMQGDAVTAIALDATGDALAVGTRRGAVLRFQVAGR